MSKKLNKGGVKTYSRVAQNELPKTKKLSKGGIKIYSRVGQNVPPKTKKLNKGGIKMHSISSDWSDMLEKIFNPEILQNLPKSIQASPFKTLNDCRGWFSASHDPSKKIKIEELQSKLEFFCATIKHYCIKDKQQSIVDFLEECLAVNTEIILLQSKFNYEQGLRDGFWLAMEILDTEQRLASKGGNDQRNYKS